jgi:DNA-binding transcriptional ArsR family regulator
MKGLSEEEQRRLIGRILAPTPEDPGPDLASLDPTDFDQGERRGFVKAIKDGGDPGDLSRDLLTPNELAAIWAQNPDAQPLACLRTITARELLTRDFPEPVWAIPGLLPVGLCILGGRPKVGKSWLALQIAQAIATGGRVLGRKVQPGAVLYLALEDSPRRLKNRMTLQGWTASHAGDADFMTLGEFLQQIGDLGGAGVSSLISQIRARKYRLIVIDTLSRSIRGDQNDPDMMTSALSPLQAVALECNAVIIVIDHHRKMSLGETDPILDNSGSIGKTGTADTIWGLYKEQGKAGAVLHVTGRDIDEERLKLTFDHDTGCWQHEGNADELKITEAKKEILDALARMKKGGVRAIAKAIGKDPGNVSRQLKDLLNDGKVTLSDNGNYALPGGQGELLPG